MFNSLELAFFLIENMCEGLILFNEQLKVVYTNKQTQTYLGLQHHDLMGKHCSEIMEGFLCGEAGILTQAIKTGELQSIDVAINDKQMQIKAFAFKGTENEEAYKAILFKPLSFKEETTETTIQKTEVDANEFTEDIIDAIKDLSEAKNISVTPEIEENLEPLFMERSKLEVAVINLLSKAINFSEKGFIKFIIQERDTGNSHIFKIENPEDDIREDELKGLRDTFSRGADKAKNTIEQHGGKLWLEQADIGFSFNFTLPKNLL